MAIIHAKQGELDELISNHPRILLNFWAEWCAPCRCFWPTLDLFSEMEGEFIQVVKVNIDKERALAERFQVKGIPNSIVIVNGEIKGSIAGIVSCEELRNRVKSFI